MVRVAEARGKYPDGCECMSEGVHETLLTYATDCCKHGEVIETTTWTSGRGV